MNLTTDNLTTDNLTADLDSLHDQLAVALSGRRPGQLEDLYESFLTLTERVGFDRHFEQGHDDRIPDVLVAMAGHLGVGLKREEVFQLRHAQSGFSHGGCFGPGRFVTYFFFPRTETGLAAVMRPSGLFSFGLLSLVPAARGTARQPPTAAARCRPRCSNASRGPSFRRS